MSSAIVNSDDETVIVPTKKLKRVLIAFKNASAELRARTNTLILMSREQREELRNKRYEKYLSPSSLYKLDSVSKKKMFDGMFVKNVLKELYAYEQRADELHSRTLFGLGSKKKMTPEKVNVVRKLVGERVLNAPDCAERSSVDNVNQLIIKQLSYFRPKKLNRTSNMSVEWIEEL